MVKCYFNREKELYCKCGCKDSFINDELVSMLNFARGIADVPFIINSGHRCIEHNNKIGGSQTSSHIRGLAVDIKATDSVTRCKILRALFIVGFNRVGLAPNFIHADIDTDKSRDVMWLY